MNEGMRCDRISLMNAGRVLACDAPQKLIDDRGAASLEEAFIACMIEGAAEDAVVAGKAPKSPEPETAKPAASHGESERSFWALAMGRLLAYTHNETQQILRDPIRLTFAFVGSALLMLVFGFGITTDVEHIRYAAFDQDHSPESRLYLEQFAA